MAYILVVWQAIYEKIPDLMAYIFALWTLQNTQFYKEMEGVENRECYLQKPHPGQVVSIFRLLGVGYSQSHFLKLIKTNNDELRNNLIQIGTGEGKSIILGVTCCILALFDIDVSCACYSEYLSTRDYNSFYNMFNLLNLEDKIHYGTFNKICENLINESGEIREKIINYINNRQDLIKIKLTEKNPKILLIDEVDIFFSKDFYGNLYRPLANINDQAIIDLVDYIWSQKQNKINYKKIQSIQQFQKLCSKYKDWEFLIQEAVKDMLADLKNYEHQYLIIDDKIAYKDNDTISFDVVYGYKTMFAYYNEWSKGNISRESLNKNINIGINNGQFSYAEIPKQFQFIMGVTGTLKTINKVQEIIQEKYKIEANTYMPSVFGQNQLDFPYQKEVYIENNDDYYNRLIEKIKQKVGQGDKKRAVLVFFETIEKLMNFYQSEQFDQSKLKFEFNVQKLTEEVSTKEEKERIIKGATKAGSITLSTAIFGRGTDFISKDLQVINNGGLHVIQAFMSSDISEEVQIKGRTARQGKAGSFGMVILDSDVEKFLGVQYKQLIEEYRSKSELYSQISQKRTEYFDQQYNQNNDFVFSALQEHQNSMNFIQDLNEKKILNIQMFLKVRNKGAIQDCDQCRTICLMDATGSMGSLLQKAQQTVNQMFERIKDILTSNGMKDDIFQLQFVVYRDYDQLIEGILQHSSWESKSDNLYKFMETVTAKGGGDYEEAIEIGLQHCNQENDKEEISQIILIGDAPAKSQDQIKQYRNTYKGEDYWQSSKFGNQTHYLNELNKLREKGIPVNTFYLNNGCKKNFEEIAQITKGKCGYLELNSLVDIMSEKILSKSSQNEETNQQLVEAYKKKYVKSYK